jgi:NADPH:quinone reductase-like Zn-dependent oxidoreductase
MAIELSAFLDKHKLHPPIAQEFAFEDADEALKALDHLSSPGKIIVRC